MGGSPPGSAGVPPAQHWQSLAHLLDPDRPAKTPGLCFARGPCGSRRQGGRVRHRRETERQLKAEDAGGTPALPGGSSRWCGGAYPGGDSLKADRRPGKLPFVRGPGPATLPRGGSSEGETTFPAYREQGPCQVNSEFRLLNMMHRMHRIDRTRGRRTGSPLRAHLRMRDQASRLQNKSCASCASM